MFKTHGKYAVAHALHVHSSNLPYTCRVSVWMGGVVCAKSMLPASTITRSTFFGK